MKHPWMVVVATLALGAGRAEAKTCHEWHTVSGTVDYTGGSTQLYAKAPVKLEIVDPSGAPAREGGYLRVTSRSDFDVFLSSTAVGLHGSGQDPKTQRSYYIAVRRPPNTMTRIDLSVRYCAKGTP